MQKYDVNINAEHEQKYFYAFVFKEGEKLQYHSTSKPPLSILHLLERQIIPLTEHLGFEQLILARLKRREIRITEGIRTSPAPKLGKRLAARGRRRCGNSHIVTAQWPEEEQEALRIPMLFCVVAGEADIRFGEYILHCREGHCIIVPPGVPHPGGRQVFLEGANCKNGYCRVLILSPRGRQMQCWMTDNRGSHFSVGENLFLLSEILADYLDRIVEEIMTNRPNSQKISYYLLLALWNILQRELKEGNFLDFKNTNTAPESILAAQTNYDPIAHAQTYIQSNLDQSLTLESVAQTVHLSRTQFARLFKQQTQQTFVEYLTQQRLQKACLFLRETNWTIGYISRFAGFKSVSYFHALFHQKMGISPLEYRKSTFANLPSSKNAQ